MKYFLHDTNARNDEKVTLLFINFGYEGLGLFYSILEILGSQEKPVNELVLKSQLKIGKRLEKHLNFMYKIEILSLKNGDVFNENLLNFSEKYQIKKEKTRKKVSEWREKQTDTNTVTSYVPESNQPKVKESKVKESKVNKDAKIDFDFLKLFNNTTGRKFTILDKKTNSQINARLKEGYTVSDFETAIKNCSTDKYHIENPQYLTPEFITRSDKLQKFLNSTNNGTTTKSYTKTFSGKYNGAKF